MRSSLCVLLLFLARRLALRALYVLDALDLRVCFTWSPSRGPSDSAEAALARLLRADGLPSGASTVSYCVGADPIAVRRYGELLYCAVASPSDDELTGASPPHHPARELLVLTPSLSPLQPRTWYTAPFSSSPRRVRKTPHLPHALRRFTARSSCVCTKRLRATACSCNRAPRPSCATLS